MRKTIPATDRPALPSAFWKQAESRAPRSTHLLGFLLFLLGLLTGCSTAPTVSSRRSVALTPERLAKGGSVCVLDLAKMKGLYPEPQEAAQTKIAEDFFRSKGFTIASRLKGADYAFSDIGHVDPAPVQHLHTLKAKFTTVHPSGLTDKELWTAEAYWTGNSTDPWGTSQTLLRAVLSRFPN